MHCTQYSLWNYTCYNLVRTWETCSRIIINYLSALWEKHKTLYPTSDVSVISTVLPTIHTGKLRGLWVFRRLRMLITAEISSLQIIKSEYKSMHSALAQTMLSVAVQSDASSVNASAVRPIVSKQGLKRHSSTASDVWLIPHLLFKSESQTGCSHSAAYGVCVRSCMCMFVNQKIWVVIMGCKSQTKDDYMHTQDCVCV